MAFGGLIGKETQVDLSQYVTETELNSKGFATQSWVGSQGYATQSWVNSQGFAKTSQIPSVPSGLGTVLTGRANSGASFPVSLGQVWLLIIQDYLVPAIGIDISAIKARGSTCIFSAGTAVAHTNYTLNINVSVSSQNNLAIGGTSPGVQNFEYLLYRIR